MIVAALRNVLRNADSCHGDFISKMTDARFYFLDDKRFLRTPGDRGKGGFCSGPSQ